MPPARPSSDTQLNPILAGDRLVFATTVDLRSATRFRRLMHRARERDQSGFTFDFSSTTWAEPEAMMHLVAQADGLRRMGMHFDVIAPQDRRTRAVFEHSNWAHHLNPVMYDHSDSAPPHHLPVRRYAGPSELKGLIDQTLDIVLATTRIERQNLRGLEWAMQEITDNVLVHADAPDGGLVAVTTLAKRKRIQFVVADAGRGIPASMRTGHPNLRRDVVAIGEALKQGVTRSRKVGQGNGLAGALRIATSAGGRFHVESAGGSIMTWATRSGPRQSTRTFRPHERLLGTVVCFELRTDLSLNLEQALQIPGRVDDDWGYLDATFDLDSGEVRLLVSEEAPGTGTRDAGRLLRTKAENLLRADPQLRVLLDWSGLPSVSSSFADEVVGKLFVTIGPTAFMSRVALVGMEPLVRGLVDRAVLQRVTER